MAFLPHPRDTKTNNTRFVANILCLYFSILRSLLHADIDNSINAGCKALPEYQEESYQISWDR